MSVSNKLIKPIYVETLAQMPNPLSTNNIGATYYIANIKALWLYTGGVSGTGTTRPTLATGTVGQPNATYNEGSGKFFGLVSGVQSTITGAASTITSGNLTANRALISNGSGKVAVSVVTSTELGYLDGVTSGIQAQLNNKLNATAKGETSNKTLSFGGTFKVLQTLANGTVNERVMTLPAQPSFTNNYLTGVTGSGNGTVTFARQGLSSLTWDASHTHTWGHVTGKPSFATVATSGSYTDLSNTPSAMTAQEGNDGTVTTPRLISSDVLASTIAAWSPPGSRPASDVQAWAKSSQAVAANRFLTVNNNTASWRTQAQMRSDLGLATVASSGSYDDLTGKPTIPTIPSLMTQTDINNGTATQRTINASLLNTNYLRANGNVGDEEEISIGTTSSSFTNIYLGKKYGGGHIMFLGGEEDLAEVYLPLDLYEGATVHSSKIVNPASVVNRDYVDGAVNTLKIVTLASTTLNLSHAGCMIQPNTASARTYTIPLHSSVPYPIGTRIQFLRRYTGSVTITRASTSITINGGASVSISDQYKMVEIFKVDTNTWIAIGALS